ncbi:MAG: hypothetical protein IPN03_17330 [Holophagales bacterium]|nr:hypothetical protein [Holophagales bacterium]
MILDDGKGSFWMTCNKGVFRVSREELDAVADGRAVSLRSVAFRDIRRDAQRERGGRPAARGLRGRGRASLVPDVPGRRRP